MRTRTGFRLGAMQGFYYEIAQAAYLEYRAAAPALAASSARLAALDPEREPEPWFAADAEHDRLSWQASSAAIRTIVFAGMCLEAAIYDFAGWHLPAQFVDNLDRIDFVEKWMMIPVLADGTGLPRGGQAHTALAALRSQRNLLVHAKSEEARHGDALDRQVAKLLGRGEAIRAACRTAMEAVIYCSLEMDERNPDLLNPLPRFAARPSPDEGDEGDEEDDRPAEIRTLISSCRASLRASRGRAAGGGAALNGAREQP